MTIKGVKRLLSLARPEARLLAISITTMAISTAVNLVLPSALGSLIDAAAKAATIGSTTTTLNTLAAGLTGLFLAGGLATWARSATLSIAGERIAIRMRKQLFRSLLKDHPIEFHDKSRSGELMNRLAVDVSVVSTTVTENISYGLRSLAQGIGGIAILFYLCPQLALVTLAVFPPIGVAAFLFGRWRKMITKQLMDSLARTQEIAQEKIAQVRTVRTFAREDFEQQSYAQRLAEYFSLAKRDANVGGLFYGTIHFAGNMSLLAVLWYGGILVNSGVLSIGGLASFCMYSIYVGFSFGGLSELYANFAKAIGAAERVWDIVDNPAAIANAASVGRRLPSIHGRIEFHNITFSYPSRPDVTIFQNLNLTLEAGSVMAVVGPSGSGKSTLGALLSRFYDVQQGCILLDYEHDIRELDQTWLREQIGFVSQEPVLFSTSIRENIRYGKLDATEEEVMEAARQANLEFVNSFPQGFDTEVGERGVTLSGGQRQRLAIARAILKNPRILVLDEATSALDAESEHLVAEALEHLMVNRTVIIIAHRLNTIKRADLIAVLSGGSVAELGTLPELLAKPGGIFRHLVMRQMGGIADTMGEASKVNGSSSATTPTSITDE